MQEKNFWFQRIKPFDKNKWQNHVVDNSAHMFKGDISGFTAHAIMKSLPLEMMHIIINDFEEKYNLNPMPYININRDELIKICRSGLIEIGAHTLNHPILVNENEETAKREIIGSIEGLYGLIRKKARCFAYPNGSPEYDFGEREKDILKNYGIELAFSTESNYVLHNSNKMSIPRVGVTKGGHFYVTQKIRFAKQWQAIRNSLYRNTEFKDRISLSQIKKLRVSQI